MEQFQEDHDPLYLCGIFLPRQLVATGSFGVHWNLRRVFWHFPGHSFRLDLLSQSGVRIRFAALSSGVLEIWPSTGHVGVDYLCEFWLFL